MQITAMVKAQANKAANRFGHAGARIALGAGLAGTMLVSGVSAVDVNWTPIADLLEGVGGTLLPAILNLVVAAVPIIITLAVVGFVLGFFDKILDALRSRL